MTQADADAVNSDRRNKAGEPRARSPKTFLFLFEDLLAQLDAISDLVNVVTPHVEELDGMDRIMAPVVNALEEVPDSHREQVVEIFKDFTGNHKEPAQFFDELVESFGDKDWGWELVRAWQEALKHTQRTPIMLNSLLVNAVSVFEAYLARIATSYYSVAPSAVEEFSREKEFSLADLRQIGDVSAAVDFSISRRVDGLLFGGLADWRKFFKDKVKIDFAEFAIDWKLFQEIFQRRHVIVHNGARANSKYIGHPASVDASPGQALDCDVEYLSMAIDQLLVIGAIFAAEMSRKFGAEDEFVASNFSLRSYDLLCKDRWTAVVRLTAYELTLPSSQSTRNTAQVNNWLARKCLGGTDAVQREISDWDVSASSVRFRLAKACLEDEIDQALLLLETLWESSEISEKHINEWPILDSVRNDQRFEALDQRIRQSMVADLPLSVLTRPNGRVFHSLECAKSGAAASPVLYSEVANLLTPARCCRTQLTEIEAAAQALL